MFETIKEFFSILPSPILFGFLIVIVAVFGIHYVTRAMRRKEIRDIEENKMEMSIEQFRDIRKKSRGADAIPEYTAKFNFTGCYVIHNKTKDKYYVGQSENVLKRANNHFRGRGSADLYADYTNGDDEWSIRLHKLHDSGFNRLNAHEKHLITLYDAYHNGYNKTRGNRHV